MRGDDLAHAREILDSRGNPTVETDVVLSAVGRMPNSAGFGYPEAGVEVYRMPLGKGRRSLADRKAVLRQAPDVRFAGGVMRFAYETVDDLKRVTDITDEEVATSDFGTNTREEFLELIRRTSS